MYKITTLVNSEDKAEQIEYICKKILKSNYIDSMIYSRIVNNTIEYRIEITHECDNDTLVSRTDWNSKLDSLYNTLSNRIATSIMTHRLSE